MAAPMYADSQIDFLFVGRGPSLIAQEMQFSTPPFSASLRQGIWITVHPVLHRLQLFDNEVGC